MLWNSGILLYVSQIKNRLTKQFYVYFITNSYDIINKVGNIISYSNKKNVLSQK